MTGWGPTAANAALAGALPLYQWIQLHVEDPGPNGTDGVAVNSDRRETTWSNPAGGLATNTSDLLWLNVAESETYFYWSAWSEETDGVFGLSGSVSALPVIFARPFMIPFGGLVASLPVAAYYVPDQPNPTPIPDPEEPPPPDPDPEEPPDPGGVVTQTLGIGGIATAAAGPNVTLLTASSGSTLNITTNNRIYDGRGFTVPKIIIDADGVTVQNFRVNGGGNAGIYSLGTGNTIQNNDISEINEGGEGDINGITFFGNNTRVLFNRIDNLVDGELNGSHTDGIQCWATPSKGSSSDVTIKGNYVSGPTDADERYIHQGVMAEGPESEDGGGGASGQSARWLVEGNYFKTYGNQCLKFDDIDDVTITKNTFAGSCNKIVATGSISENIVFANDNIITGTYGTTVGD